MPSPLLLTAAYGATLDFLRRAAPSFTRHDAFSSSLRLSLLPLQMPIGRCFIIFLRYAPCRADGYRCAFLAIFRRQRRLREEA